MVEKITKLLKEKGISFMKADNDLGFGNGAIKKFDTNKPSIEKVIALANYLDVSLDYLVDRKIDTDQITPLQANSEPTAQIDINGMDKWKQLQEQDKYYIIGQMDALINKTKDKRKLS